MSAELFGESECSQMDLGALDNLTRWYAVRTKPKEEARADINLRIWLVQTFSPRLKVIRTSSYRGCYVSKPLFAGYIFAHFDASKQLHDINYTRGVQNVVSFGGSPISIDDKVINLLRAKVAEDGFIDMDEALVLGDRVRINSGPFANLHGIFKRKTKDKDRVRILLDAMNYQSHLLIDRELIEKVY
jgi:transcriptional antiterminator RfaH